MILSWLLELLELDFRLLHDWLMVPEAARSIETTSQKLLFDLSRFVRWDSASWRTRYRIELTGLRCKGYDLFHGRLPLLRGVSDFLSLLLDLSHLIHGLLFHTLLKLTPVLCPVRCLVLLGCRLIEVRNAVFLLYALIYLLLLILWNLRILGLLRGASLHRFPEHRFSVLRSHNQSSLRVVQVVGKEPLLLANDPAACEWSIELSEGHKVGVCHCVTLEIL